MVSILPTETALTPTYSRHRTGLQWPSPGHRMGTNYVSLHFVLTSSPVRSGKSLRTERISSNSFLGGANARRNAVVPGHGLENTIPSNPNTLARYRSGFFKRRAAF